MVSVLVVDDNAVTVQLMELILKREEYNVLKAYSGEEALHLTFAHRPDVLILNDSMAGLSGGEVCLRIKTNQQTADIAIVLCSAGLRIHNRNYITQVQADLILPKPCLPDEIIAVVESALAKKRKA
jgi:CheY-like chemotaxis protein